MRVPGAGTIIERRGTFYCRWRRKGYPDVQRKAGTKRNTTKVLSLVQARRLDGATLEAAVRSVFGDPEPEGVTLGRLTDLYLESLKDVRTAANLRREQARGNVFKAEFQKLTPDKLDAAAVARGLEALGRTRSPKSRNRFQAFGSKVWRYGQQHGYASASSNPFRTIDRVPEIPVEGVTFTKGELDAILKHMPTEIADYALAQAQSCWRPIELEALTWADLEGGTLRVPAIADKARRGKRTAISPQLNAALEARRGVPRALIFAQRNGKPWACKTRGKRFARALEAAVEAEEIPAHKSNATWYSLKASGLTVLLASGVSPAVVSQMSGVAIGTIMKHYAGAMHDAQAEALNVAWGE